MIPVEEIKAAAKASNVPTSTIERDFAQNWLLASLAPIELALKGGTGIRKAYIAGYRFSDDLDFTALRVIGLEEIRRALLTAVASARDASLIPFESGMDMRENQNGFVTELYFGMLLSGRSRLKIKVDISKQSSEGHLLPLVSRPLIHPYSDRCRAALAAYALEEMAAEKVRSLFQRTRARDLFDVHRLVVGQKIDRGAFEGILRRKFEIRSVVADMAELQSRKPQFKSGWKQSLKHQMGDVPDFEQVYGEVRSDLERLPMF
jgi:predicted nucleotidyltransferase component of viral defense system